MSVDVEWEKEGFPHLERSAQLSCTKVRRVEKVPRERLVVEGWQFPPRVYDEVSFYTFFRVI